MAFDFSYAGNLGPGAERAPNDFALGDINNDGYDDFVFTQSQGVDTSHIGVRLGDGRNHWSFVGDYDSPGNKGGIRLADVNHDGALDMVYTGIDDGTLRVRYGIGGGGTFGSEFVRGQLAPTISPSSLLSSLELADINGDGNLDAVGGSVNSGIRILYDNGTGTFNLGGFNYDNAGGVNNLKVMDVTGDGAPDVVYTTRVGLDLAVLTNLRTANPGVSGTNLLGGLDANTQIEVFNGPTGIVWAISEDPESGNGRVVFGRSPGANPTNVGQLATTYQDVDKPAIADFNGDDVPDIAFSIRKVPSSNESSLLLFPGSASGAPFGGSATTYTEGYSVDGTYAVDLNADGVKDILTRNLGRADPYDDFNIFISNQQSLVVSTTVDENDGNARWNSGNGTSLREAMAYANSILGTRTISFAPFLGNDNAVVNVTNGPLGTRGVGEANFTITNTRGRVTISGGNTASTLFVSGASTLTIRNVTISNFRSGSIFGADCGALYVDFDGRLNLESVALATNTATGRGGALLATFGAQVALRNCTIYDNGGAAAIANMGAMVLENNTIISNINTGVINFGGALTLNNNLFAANNVRDLTNSGSLNGTNNMFRDGDTGGLSNTLTDNARVFLPTYNGGFTLTCRLSANSPAINAGATLASVSTDPRGVPRPQNGAYDIGAFETRIASTPSLNPNSFTVPTNGSLVNLFIASNPNPSGGTFSGEGVSNGYFNPAGLSTGVKTITYSVLPAGFDLPGTATLSINVVRPVVSAATVGVRLSSSSVRETDGLSVFVDVSNMRDQYGNPFTPSSGSVTLYANGAPIGTQTFSTAQLQLGAFTSLFGYAPADDNPTGTPVDTYAIAASVTLDAYNTSGSANLTVNNSAPEAVNATVPASINQGQSFDLTGNFFDLGTQDTHVVTIDWKDGTPNSVLNLTLGARNFAASHTYAPQAGAPTHYDIGVTITDDDTGTVTVTRGIDVIRYFESLIVTTTQDEDNGTSDAGVGAGTSLREAVKYAWNHAGPDTITFASSLVGQTVTLSSGWNDANDHAALRIGPDVTIQGSGQTLAVASGVRRQHIFVESGGSLTVSGLTFTGGNAPGYGGAIWSFGSLTVRNATFTGNTAASEGGAIHSWGDSPLLVVENSTFSGNVSNGVAGAIDAGAQTITLRNLTITNNTAANGDAVVIYKNPATLVNSIVAGNPNDGIGLQNGASLAAGSTNNILGDGGAGGLTDGVNGNRTGVNASALKLGALAGNGGPTRTYAPLPGSPAINAGVAIAGVSTDQRGVPRPQYGAADIGAVEYAGATESLVVTTTGDENDFTSDPAFGGGTSLREAVRAAQAPTSLTGFGTNGGGWTFNHVGGGSPANAAGSVLSPADVLTLTTAEGGESNSAWYNRKVDVDQFTASFTYSQNAGTGGADGFTLTFQNAGLNALGGGGGGLGYLGIGQSAAIAFNIYNNGSTVRPGFAVFSGGATSGGVYTPIGNGVSLTNGQPVNITVTGAGAAVTLTMSQGANSFTTTFPTMNIAAAVGGNVAYVGFTGATGGSVATQRITNFNFTSAAVPATVTFAPSLSGQTITIVDGWNGATDDTALRVDTNVTIDGGNDTTINLAAPVKRRLLLGSGASNVTLSGLALSGGDVTGVTDGGAVWSNGTLLVQNSTFTNNKANYGGAIESYGSLTVRDSTFNGNQAVGDGGAIHSATGAAVQTIQNSTFVNNSAQVASAVTTGAATNQWDHLTVVDNTAQPGGGAVDVYQTSVTMRNSVVARNTNDGALTGLGDATGAFSAASVNNIVGAGSWTGLNPAFNTLGVSDSALKLGTLLSNGGPTRTVALLAGSPAINAAATIASITTDQRGVARPQHGAPDIGAYEFDAPANQAPSFNLPGNPSAANFNAGPQSVANFVSDVSAGSPAESGQTLTFSLTLVGSTTLRFKTAPQIDPLTGTLSYEAAPGSFGSATFSVVLSDDGPSGTPHQNTSATQSFTLVVSPSVPTVNAPSNPSIVADTPDRVPLGSFNDVDPLAGPWNVTVDFGDGSATESFTLGQNLLQNPQAINLSPWGRLRTSVTADAGTAPDGSNTADLIAAVGYGQHYVQQGTAKPAQSLRYTFSFYVKGSGLNGASAYLGDDAGNYAAGRFDLAAGAATSQNYGSGMTVDSVTLTSVGDGWSLATLTATTTTASKLRAFVFPGTDFSFTGDGTSGVLLWNATLGQNPPADLGSRLHRYASPGHYQAKVTVTNRHGSSNEARFNVDAAYSIPTVTAPSDQSPLAGSAVPISLGSFTDPDPLGGPWNVTVDFGDGSATESFTLGQNLLQNPQAINLSPWGRLRTSVTADAGTAPDGTNTADLIAAVGYGQHYVQQGATKSAQSLRYTFSFYVKGSGLNGASAYLGDDAGNYAAGRFDLSTGAATSQNYGSGMTVESMTLTPVGDGWSLATLTAMTTAASKLRAFVFPGTDYSFTGDGTAGVLLWNATLGQNPPADLGGRLHRYASPGHYQAKVTVTNRHGSSNEASFAVDAAYSIPTVTAPSDQPPLAGTAVPIQLGSFTDPDPLGGPWNVTVDFGDGSAAESFTLGQNLLQNPQAIDLAPWGRLRTSVTADAGTAPDGSNTADLIAAVGYGQHYVQQGTTKPAQSLRYTFSFYVKRSGLNGASAYLGDDAGNFAAGRFDLAAGAATSQNYGSGMTVESATLTPMGDGWSLATLTATTNAASKLRAFVFPGTDYSFTGDGTAGVLLWNATLGQNPPADLGSRPHRYASPGQYVAKMTVTNRHGSSSQASFNVDAAAPSALRAPQPAAAARRTFTPSTERLALESDPDRDVLDNLLGCHWTGDFRRHLAVFGGFIYL